MEIKHLIDFKDVDMSIIDIIHKYKEIHDDKFSDEEFTISFEIEMINGVISPINQDTHYGMMILSDEDTIKIVKYLLNENILPENCVSWINIDYPNKITIEY